MPITLYVLDEGRRLDLVRIEHLPEPIQHDMQYINGTAYYQFYDAQYKKGDLQFSYALGRECETPKIKGEIRAPNSPDNSHSTQTLNIDDIFYSHVMNSYEGDWLGCEVTLESRYGTVSHYGVVAEMASGEYYTLWQAAEIEPHKLEMGYSVVRTKRLPIADIVVEDEIVQ